ncbi:MAG: carboxypeptidase-like regulatory domain-containing protein [Candidatus Eremiobacteraeota bacterium]|nr:carboxypeptidase-like regulatory domain-containing protein [Candidatus Eremiobacteraeota bacterium]
MKIVSPVPSFTATHGLAVATACCAALLWGCPNPNAIGVQQTGSIRASCVLASNGQPVVDALVAVNATQTAHSGSDGVALLTGVPIGPQNVTADAPGLHGGPVPVQVTENNTSSVTVQMSPSQ